MFVSSYVWKMIYDYLAEKLRTLFMKVCRSNVQLQRFRLFNCFSFARCIV